ncbi:MAG: DUF711 family protein [Anaerolineaceae bacterium]|nr:MAG: DUF711 family protein [Anaerolineaceae bacterium]
MKVRALTGFVDPGWPINPEVIKSVATCLDACRDAIQEVGIEVQTLRVATPPPSEMKGPVPPAERASLAQKLEAECFANGVDYGAIGPALPDEPEGYDVIPEVIAATESVFTSGIFADPLYGISLHAAQSCAQAIHESSTISPDGFANLRFAALANVPPGAPFFPAAFHDGGSPAIAIATEAADVAVDAILNASSLESARRHLVVAIEDHASTLSQVAQRTASKHDLRFLGIDFSLAPFPQETRSIGTAMEAFGIPAAGLSGTVAAATFIIDCLDRAEFSRTGFCGLFLPVLEDSVLAARAAEGKLTVTHLLLYATLCGTGLDTIPLPGDVTPGAMASLLVDLGALALRHNKPLTARLMPIPGKNVGDEIHYDFPYLTDSRVMNLPAELLEGLLGGSGVLDIGPRIS